MKKRFFALFILIAVLSTASAVNAKKKDNAYDVYVKASESLNSVDSLSMYMSMDMEMDINGEKMPITMEGTISQVIRSKTDIDLHMEMVTDTLGISAPMNIYYLDGIYYMDAYDQKIKLEMPIEQVLSQMNIETFSFPDSAIKDLSETETDDGTEISFTLDSSELGELLNSQLGSFAEIFSELPDISFEDVFLTALIDKDGQLVNMEMAFAFEMSILDEDVTVEYLVYIEILQIGGITIEFPDDLDTYIEQEMPS